MDQLADTEKQEGRFRVVEKLNAKVQDQGEVREVFTSNRQGHFQECAHPAQERWGLDHEADIESAWRR